MNRQETRNAQLLAGERLEETVTEAITAIRQDERTPCFYSAALLISGSPSYGYGGHQLGTNELSIWGECYRPFTPRRVVVGSPGLRLDFLYIGDMPTASVGYKLGIPSEMLLPSAWPLELPGIHLVRPGMRIELRFEIDEGSELARKLEAARNEPGATVPLPLVLLLGDTHGGK